MKGQVVKLTKMEIWQNGFKDLTGIRITLSNGEQSPYFKAKNGSQNNPVTVDLAQDLKAKKISIVAGPNACNAIRIVDTNGTELCKWVGEEDKAYRE